MEDFSFQQMLYFFSRSGLYHNFCNNSLAAMYFFKDGAFISNLI